jgi:hypothetical protein
VNINGKPSVEWEAEAPSITLMTGKDAFHKYACFYQEATRINGMKLTYNGVKGPNSNTFARLVLEH